MERGNSREVRNSIFLEIFCVYSESPILNHKVEVFIESFRLGLTEVTSTPLLDHGKEGVIPPLTHSSSLL